MSLDAGKHADAVKEAIEQAATKKVSADGEPAAATDRDPPETAGSTPVRLLLAKTR